MDLGESNGTGRPTAATCGVGNRTFAFDPPVGAIVSSDLQTFAQLPDWHYLWVQGL